MVVAPLDISGGFSFPSAELVVLTGREIYGWRRLPYHHAVWHLFVLAGSTFHFFAVLFYVIPVAV